MSGIIKSCPMKGNTAGLTGNSSVSSTNLQKIGKRLAHRWLLLGLFIIIVSYFMYLIYTNVLSIRNSYYTYKENADAKGKAIATNSRVTSNTADDDETYDRPPPLENKKQLSIDNSTIITNMDNMKTKYKPFNDLLRQHDPKTKDLIDERIVAQEYDEY
jgi:hypothetical protein